MIQASVPALKPFLPQLVRAFLISAAVALIAAAAGVPLWMMGALALLPWLPVTLALVQATWKAAGAWLTLYLILVVTQSGHVLEHVVQVVQLRVLHEPKEHAHGIFGALDVEWVHFVWNSWILLAIVVLLIGRPGNRWLLIAAPLAAWHLAEHVVLIATYLATGVEGSPGLLAMGGLIGNGLPIPRPELHLLYNVMETIPLIIGLAVAWFGPRSAIRLAASS